MSEFERAELAQNIVLERLSAAEPGHQADSPLNNNNMLKTILKINSASDFELDYFRNIALEMVENRLRKTIFFAKRQHRHKNDTIVLPYGPVCKIIKVEYGNKTLTENTDYRVSPFGDSFRISLNSMVRRGDRVLKVTYQAGYKELSGVPRSIVNAVVSVTDYLFRHNDNPEAITNLMKSLLHEYDTGEGGLF